MHLLERFAPDGGICQSVIRAFHSFCLPVSQEGPEGHTTYRRSFEMANIKSQKKRIVTNE